MNIGQVADLLGIQVQTIRFYEREGLLPPLPRTPRGYRTLDATTIRRIRFIRHAQEAGPSERSPTCWPFKPHPRAPAMTYWISSRTS
jgi:hypothetical protein